MNECDVYRRVKAEHQRPAGLLQPLAIPEWKFDHIEMDFVTGFPKSKRGNDAIFVVIDKLTKVAHFLPIKESITAAQLAELYISRIVSLPVFLTSFISCSKYFAIFLMLFDYDTYCYMFMIPIVIVS